MSTAKSSGQRIRTRPMYYVYEFIVNSNGRYKFSKPYTCNSKK